MPIGSQKELCNYTSALKPDSNTNPSSFCTSRALRWIFSELLPCFFLMKLQRTLYWSTLSHHAGIPWPLSFFLQDYSCLFHSLCSYSSSECQLFRYLYLPHIVSIHLLFEAEPKRGCRSPVQPNSSCNKPPTYCIHILIRYYFFH